MLNHCVFTDGYFRLIDPELLIVSGCDSCPDLPVYEYGANYNRQTDCIGLFWWFTGDVEPAIGGWHHVGIALLPRFLSWKWRVVNFPQFSAPPVHCVVPSMDLVTEELCSA